MTFPTMAMRLARLAAWTSDDLAYPPDMTDLYTKAEVDAAIGDVGGAAQPLDADLTAIAALTPTTDNFMVAAASAWSSRTPAQAKTSLALVKADVGLGSVDNTSDAAKPVSTATQSALDAKQPLDADLTALAGLTATTDNFIVAVASAWASRTVAQVKTTLGLLALAFKATIDSAALLDNDVVTYAKIQNVSATDKLLGRSTAGAGDVEEIALTGAGRALIDDADAAAQRTTLGLGSAATTAASAYATAAQGTDARTPLAHTHAPADVTGTAVVTADSRLSDARTPLAHTHAPADVTGTAVVTADSRLSDARTPTAHTHPPSDITGTAVVTADSRLSDSRAPNGGASGDLGDSFPGPTVTQARGLRETAGPSTLVVGAVVDGEYLKRVGLTVVSGIPTAATPETLQSNNSPAADVVVLAGYSTWSDEEFTIPDGVEMALADGASLVIL